MAATRRTPPKPTPGTTKREKTNKAGISTTVTSKNGIPTHVYQWDTTTGKRIADRDLPMKMK